MFPHYRSTAREPLHHRQPDTPTRRTCAITIRRLLSAAAEKGPGRLVAVDMVTSLSPD
ncbi:hypothetical protein GCM10010424_74550 [Streptomyces lienomycini]